MMATRSPRDNPARASSAATWLLRTASCPAVTRSTGSWPFSKTSTRRSGSRAAWVRTTRLRTAVSSISVPVGHVVADLRSSRRPVVELVVERLVDVVSDDRQVALQRVDVDGALPVLLDAVVDVGDGRFPGPVRHLDLGPVDDLA